MSSRNLALFSVFLQLIVPGTKDNLVNFSVDTAAVRSNFGKLRRGVEIRQRVSPLHSLAVNKVVPAGMSVLLAILHGSHLEGPLDVVSEGWSLISLCSNTIRSSCRRKAGEQRSFTRGSRK